VLRKNQGKTRLRPLHLKRAL